MATNAPSPAARHLRTFALGVAVVGLMAASAACEKRSDPAPREPRPVAPAEEHGHGPHLGAQARYVSLGDSYTAAPEAGRQAPGSLAGCVQSEVNYPHLVAERLEVEDHVDVSCTGATTADLFEPQLLGDGTWAPAQLDALSHETTLVTLGIGGNDIGFADVIVQCLAAAPDADPCRSEIEPGPDGLGARIEATAPKVARVLAAIEQRAPNAQVLVVGYPTIFPATGSCFETVPFTDGDVAYLHEVERELNAMLAAEAARAEVTFVDTERDSAGHDTCAGPGVRWIEGISPESPAMPFHPNALGTSASADRVVASLRAG